MQRKVVYIFAQQFFFMKLKACLALLLTGLALGSNGQDNKIKFEQYTLKNGLKVILHQDKSTPIVAVTVLYHVGSKNENPERTGFAHFFEHLMFEGSPNIKRGEYMSIVKGAGGELNANTSQDRTFYYEVLPSNQLELGLWMESERMVQLTVDSVGIETQRNVVKEERRQRMDNRPYGSLLEEVMKRAFKKHPYRWMPIGSMEHLTLAKDQEFKDFYKLFYVPNNAVLSIAGDIDPAKTKEMIEKYFGSIPMGTKPIPRPNIVEPPLGGEVRDVVYDNVQLPGVVCAYRIPAQGTPDYYAFEMLSTLLSRGNSARLQKELVDKQQKAVFAGAFPLPTEDPGVALMFAIAAGTNTAESVESAMEAEFDNVKSELISDDEFQKLRNQIETQFVSQNSEVAGIAESLANYLVYFKDANLINTEIERYMKVTKEDIRNVAKKYLVKDNRVILYYLPKSAKK